MGCTTSLPPEHEPLPPAPLAPTTHTAATIKSSSESPLSISPHRPSTSKPNDYDRILSSPGQLEIPDKFKKWFPPNHGHTHIRSLFKFHNEIGHGVTGSVHQIEYKSQICAVKQIEKNDQWARMLFETEAQVLSRLSHKGIIRFIDTFFDDKYYYLVLEKADFDLYYVMKKKGHLTETKSRNIVYSILKALKYMHKKNLAHRDLKPENIVFVATDTNNPRLIDFGDAELVRKDKKYTEFVGTPPYMSPERLEEHSGWELKKADIWATAVIAYEMYVGKRCFEGDTQKQVFASILRGDWSWPKDRIPSDDMKDFIEECLQHDAKDRPSAKQALMHPWFDVKRREEAEEEEEKEHKQHMAMDSDENKDIEIQIVEHKQEKKQRRRRMVKIKDITEIAIFENIASMVQNNPLQELLVKGHIEIMKEDDLTPYKEQFDALDVDKDGSITGPDLVTTFTNNGISSHQASSLASILLTQLDTNRSGKISFKQFLTARTTYDIANRSRQVFNDIMAMSCGNMRRSGIVSEKECQVQDAFDSECSDVSPSPYPSLQPAWKHREDQRKREILGITQRDIIIYSKSTSNIPVNRDELRALFCKYDKDGDGRLSYDDFAQAVKTTVVVDAEVNVASSSDGTSQSL